MLRQGSILMVTSYATRTSRSFAGNSSSTIFLAHLRRRRCRTCPALDDNKETIAESLPVRERLMRIAPIQAGHVSQRDRSSGFSLENFDAVGRWRITEEESPLTPPADCPWQQIHGVGGLEAALLKIRRFSSGTLSEKPAHFRAGPRLRVF
jgi:hypothetical protein